MEDSKFEHFKKLIIEHLGSLDENEKKELRKSLIEAESMQKGGYSVGTIRTWKGKQYIKIAPGKWKPKYNGQTRGAKMAISALKKMADKCTNSKELLQLVLANKSRFSDDNGRPLPFVQELADYVSERNDKIESDKKAAVKTAKLDEGNKRKESKENNSRKTKKEDKTITDLNSFKQKMKDKGYTLYREGYSDEHKYTDKGFYFYGKDKPGSSTDFSIKYVGITKKIYDGYKTGNYDKLIESMGYTVGSGYSVEPMRVRTAIENNKYTIIEQPEQDKNKESDFEKHKNHTEAKPKIGIEAIRDKYVNAKQVKGDEDTITLPDGSALEGTWKLVEADTPTASHNENTFTKTEGFPTNEDGSTINDRDYEHDKAAKEAVLDISSDFDARALGIDNPVVVSEDGVVISGNNRTMSSKLAAKKGTDTKYVEALEKKCKKFGFTPEDVSKFKNPRVVFETKVNGKYSTKQFAKFNQSGKKAQSPVEVAVKVSKTVNTNTIENVAEKINQYDTIGELYADNKAMQDVFNTLINNNVIQKTDLPAYYTDESGVTNNGKEFLETVLIGSVINESNIRSLSSPGGKEIRQKLVRAIVPLIENNGMKGYSINKELNEAVSISIDIKKNKQFANAEEYSKQNVLFGEKADPIAIEFAKKMEGTQKEFAEFMQSLNGGLRPAADGEADIFLGGIESRDDILSRYIHIKKSVWEVLHSIIA